MNVKDDVGLFEVVWAFGLLYYMWRCPEHATELWRQEHFIDKIVEARTQRRKRRDASIRSQRSQGEGQNQTPEYRIWAKIKSRCKPDGYYGKRGIRLCERWNDYEAFLADVGRRPSAEHILVRLKPASGFDPDNCEWQIKATSLGLRTPKRRLSADAENGIRVKI
jgi:hypothetical protein